MKRINGLNGLRAISIIFIILYHANNHLFKGGFVGVIFFFMLSGYLMMHTTKPDLSVLTYYKKRIKRIYPMLILMLLLSSFLFLLLHIQFKDHIKLEVLSILFGYNNFYQINNLSSYFTALNKASPFLACWFIAIMIQLYFIWPWFYKLYLKINKKNIQTIYLFIPVLISLIFSIYACILHKDISYIYYHTLSRMGSFFFGAFIYHIQKYYPFKLNNKLFPISLIIYLCLLFILPGESYLTYSIYFPIIHLLFACTLSSLSSNYASLLDNKLQFVSKYSYELYLFHYPLFYIVENYTAYTFIKILICLLILLIFFYQQYLKKLRIIFIIFCIIGAFHIVNAKDNQMKILDKTLKQNEEIIKKQKLSSANITFIGDSVMLDNVPYIKKYFPNSYIDAKQSRHFSKALPIIKSLNKKHALTKIIVIGLGTNGPINKKEIHELVKYIGNKHIIYFINTFGNHITWIKKSNQSIMDVVKTYNYVHLINWHDYAKNHSDWFWNDGIHPNVDGGKIYAKFLKDNIKMEIITKVKK